MLNDAGREPEYIIPLVYDEPAIEVTFHPGDTFRAAIGEMSKTQNRRIERGVRGLAYRSQLPATM